MQIQIPALKNKKIAPSGNTVATEHGGENGCLHGWGLWSEDGCLHGWGLWGKNGCLHGWGWYPVNYNAYSPHTT
jgi:hypothetical protein